MNSQTASSNTNPDSMGQPPKDDTDKTTIPTTTTTTTESTSIVIPSSLLTTGSTSNIVPSTYIFESCTPLIQSDMESSIITPATIVQDLEQTDTVFGSLQEPISFSDLAKTQESSTTTTPTTSSNLSKSNATDGNKDSLNTPKINLPPPPDHPHRISTSMSDFSPGPYIPPFIPPTSSLRTSMPPPSTATTTTITSNTNDSNKNSASRTDLLYSPPPTSSPPLDSIPMSVGQLATTTTTTTSSTTTTTSITGLANNKIPKISSSTTTSSTKSNYDSMELLPLQKRYRSIEAEQKQLSKKRHDIEKKINDMARSAHGKNIDLDPNFRNLKEQKRKYNDEIQQATTALRKIYDTLVSKFDVRISSSSSEILPFQKQQPISRRAKMSTGPKVNRNDSKVESNNRGDSSKKYMFEFHDCKSWCEPCDQHFETVSDYLKHLHKRDHIMNTRKTSTPWRSHTEIIDRKKTYNLMKSICAKVGNELGQDFSVQNLDRILIPNASKDTYKAIAMSRERERWDKEDSLFEPKGLNYLIPVEGYYCTLCSKTLCDQVEVNLHMRSHDHNYAFVKSVCLNPDGELKLRSKYERSYKKRFGTNPKCYSVDKTTNIVKEIDSRIMPGGTRAILKSSQRKDADKQEEDKVSNTRDKIASRMPVMIPLSESTYKPSALKRLRTDSTDKALKDIIQPSSTSREKIDDVVEMDDEDQQEENRQIAGQQIESETREDEIHENSDEEVIEIPHYDESSDYEDPLLNIGNQYDATIVLRAGEPDNPFPELDLGISGNLHIDNLKDERLKANTRVILQKIDLEMYKDILLDPESLWTRVNQLMTKKEPKFSESPNARNKPVTAPTFFGCEGKSIPIDLDDEDGFDSIKRKPIIKSEPSIEDTKKQHRLLEKLSDCLSGDDKNENVDTMPPSETSPRKSKSNKDADMEVDQVTKDKNGEKDERDSISPLGEPPLSMNFLNDFFCEK